MCGISGIASADVDALVLERMSAALQHRGPDSHGAAMLAHAGFAHARLAIIDLSPGGHQPMSDRQGEIHVTYNGEIYNFVELREELRGRGHEFRSSSDTEVLIAAYREWGRECLRRLNGMFAFALFDSRDGTLLLARDRAGEKPLFWWHTPGKLVFGSELKALAVDPAFPRTISLPALDSFLAYGYTVGTQSIFEGVRKLAPAHALLYDTRRDTVDTWAYWDLPAAAPDDATDDELLDELERLLADSVRRQLVAADVPVGVLLSGGIDSSLITALASRASSKPVKTFTVNFPGHGRFDEGPRARIVARHFGTDHTDLLAESASLDVLPLLARQFDDPIADHAMIPTYLVSAMIREHAKVALTGDGGDELFGGYPHYAMLARQERVSRLLPRFVRRRIAHAADRYLPVGVRGRNHITALAGDDGHGIAHVNLYFDAATRVRLVPALAARHGSSPEQLRLAAAGSGTLLRRAQQADFRTTLPDGYLVKVDRASMLRSLETRAPFLDQRIIEFAFGRVPDRLKVRGSEMKVLPRRLAKKLLPPELDMRGKQGFTMPLAAWFEHGWGAMIEEVLQDSLFDRTFVAELLEGQRRGRNNTGRLFALMIFELWRREYRATLP
ncbi:MAG TPA: asparagine synthase (glutamine-hydrolyzing) [Thermoanaerobaculia bacterium]|jgi:asparagine synthase (glutamine-hydrolysing)